MKRAKRTEKQLESARNTRSGGRPRTGQTARVMVSLPADIVERIDAQAGNVRYRVRWMVEQLTPILDALENLPEK